jgi:hypothetical protein
VGSSTAREGCLDCWREGVEAQPGGLLLTPRPLLVAPCLGPPAGPKPPRSARCVRRSPTCRCAWRRARRTQSTRLRAGRRQMVRGRRRPPPAPWARPWRIWRAGWPGCSWSSTRRPSTHALRQKAGRPGGRAGWRTGRGSGCGMGFFELIIAGAKSPSLRGPLLGPVCRPPSLSPRHRLVLVQATRT